MSNINWLEKWYKHHCNGPWEHLYGIKIETLDNPGWHVEINLNETEYVNLKQKNSIRDMGSNDWINCSIVDGTFNGCGDCMKLEEIIETFKEWVVN